MTLTKSVAVAITVAVVDDVDKQLTCGEEGEIVVRGENIFLEYWEKVIAKKQVSLEELVLEIT